MGRGVGGGGGGGGRVGEDGDGGGGEAPGGLGGWDEGEGVEGGGGEGGEAGAADYGDGNFVWWGVLVEGWEVGGEHACLRMWWGGCPYCGWGLGKWRLSDEACLICLA